MKLTLKGRIISEGVAEGEALVTSEPISFTGIMNPQTGDIMEKKHELYGRSVANKILVFPRGRGSTTGSYMIYRMAKSGTAPKAIINVETEPIIAVGAILSGIPLIDKLDRNPIEVIKTGDHVKVDAEKGFVEVTRTD